MHNILQAALGWTVEYKEWGWNARTLSSLMMIGFTFPEVWGIIKQGQTIWKDESTKSVSVHTFAFLSPFFFVCAAFGIYLHSSAMLINAALTGLAQIPIVLGFLKFRGLSKKEWVAAIACWLMPVWMLATPYKGESYLAFSFGLWYAFGAQVWELWRERKCGELDGRMVLVFCATTVAWTTFAFCGDDVFFKLSQVGISTTIVSTTVLWTMYWMRDNGLVPEPLRRFVRKGPA